MTIFSFLFISPSNSTLGERNINSSNDIISDVDFQRLLLTSLYTECELQDKLDYNVFKQAMDGYNSIELTNNKLLSIIDYSKPSTEKRFFIIDVEKHKLLYNTLVAHGKKSGYPLKEGDTTLLVAHYSCLNGKDICRMWVNPSLDRKPPFDAHDMAYCDSVDIGLKKGVLLNVQPHGEGDYDFDEIRVGRTWEEVIGRR